MDKILDLFTFLIVEICEMPLFQFIFGVMIFIVILGIIKRLLWRSY